jgi:hypothetical protein
MNDTPLTTAEWVGLSKRWVWGVALVMATAAFIGWLAVGAGWPHFASLLAATLIAYGLFRFARVNGYGLALWLVGTMLVISFSGISQNGWFIRGLDVLCAFAMMVIMLISCVVFLVTAFDDQTLRGRHCAACVMVVSSVFIPASCAATSVRNAQYLKSVAFTTETLLTLNRLGIEIEAIRARLGRLPEGEQELVTLRGAPMPTFYEDYRISYERRDEQDYILSCTLDSFWGHGWDLFGWIVHYKGPDAPRRMQVILF